MVGGIGLVGAVGLLAAPRRLILGGSLIDFSQTANQIGTAYLVTSITNGWRITVLSVSGSQQFCNWNFAFVQSQSYSMSCALVSPVTGVTPAITCRSTTGGASGGGNVFFNAGGPLAPATPLTPAGTQVIAGATQAQLSFITANAPIGEIYEITNLLLVTP